MVSVLRKHQKTSCTILKWNALFARSFSGSLTVFFVIFFSLHSTHGIGVPRYRVLSEFLKSYSKRGDVASKSLKFGLELRWPQLGNSSHLLNLMDDLWLKAYKYNIVLR